VQRVIHLDLPSVLSERQTGHLARLKERVGGGGGEREQLTLSTLAVVEGLAEGLRAAGVDDVVRFEVDGENIFEDTRDETGDLPFIVTQAIGAGLIDKPFQEMQLHARDELNGKTVQLVAYVRADVQKGDEEVRLNCRAPAGVLAKAFDARVGVIARALAKEFGDARFRIVA
jgi:hypothetical protein